MGYDMKRLPNAVLSNFILDLYSPGRDMDFSRHVLAVFNTYIPCVAVAYASFDRTASKHEVKGISTQKPNHLSQDDMDHVNRLITRRHPYIPHFRSIHSNPVLSISEMMTTEEWRNSRVFNELYRPFGISHNTCVRFYQDTMCHIFGINDTAPMHSEHREMLALSAQHLKRAFCIHSANRNDVVHAPDEGVRNGRQHLDHVLINRGFTQRECEVLQQLCKGSSNKQIAGDLGISSKTVGRHLENIFQKMECSNRHSAMQMIWEWRASPGRNTVFST